MVAQVSFIPLASSERHEPEDGEDLDNKNRRKYYGKNYWY